jgi:acyl-CoA reductase-like NAD-dependent aldehyde dehydrogenase
VRRGGASSREGGGSANETSTAPGYEELLERLGSLAASIVVGSPADPQTVAGPVISAAQRERVEGFVSSAADEGATIVAGGARPPLERGFFVALTLLGGCRNDMDAVRNEIFGPVITVIPFDDDGEAIALANDSEYGLVDYVYSRDLARAIGVADRLQAGTIQVNTTSMKDDMPRGGVKRSGLGRNGGEFGLLSYTEPTGVVWA